MYRHIKSAESILLILVAAIFLALPVQADYLDTSASLYANHSSNVTIRGFLRLDNTSGINNTNITVRIGNSNFTVFTNTSFNWSRGFFELNVTAPNSTGRFNVTVIGGGLSESIEIYVSNLTGMLFNFTATRPPFANGSTFTMNISFFGKSNVVPKLEIFNPNGVNSTGWVIQNLTPRINNVSSILYNITVPAAAEGRYVLLFEEGAGSTVFLVKSSLVVVAEVQDTANSTTTSFGQGETMQIVGKVRDVNNPITNATVTAFVTLPNGTVASQSLSHSSTNGTYTGLFTGTSLPGSYNIVVVANVSGKLVRASASAVVQSLEAELEIVKDFFFDFGSSSAFQRGGIVEFHVLVFNLTNNNDILLNGSVTTNAGADVNCTAMRVVELKNVLNSSALSSPSLTKTLGLFFGQNVCKIRFTAPDADGIYSLSVNASVGASQANNLSVIATGYFAVQSYILKPSPVSSLGAGHEFLSFLMPGDNATFELSVRNLSASGGAVAGNLITSFNVTRITPMDFIGGGQSEITNIQVLEYTNGTATANPKIKLRVPENRTGPFQIEFQVTVAGSVIRGNSFYFARYVEGFAFPASFGGGFSHGGQEGGGTFRCSGLQNFTAQIFDVRTRQSARNVVFNSIQEAREELTGKSVIDLISIASSSSTDTNGIGNITIRFNDSFSGFYFMLINITTSDGKSDSLPGGFECRQLSFFPDIRALGATGDSFFVAPTSGLNVTVSGIRNLNTGNVTLTGSVNIVKIESFDPVKGHKAIAGPSTTYPLVSGSAAFNVFPANFTGLGGKWFSGFNDLRIRVCDNSTSPQTCDTTFGGFMVVPFDAYPDFSVPPPSSLTAGENVTYRIMAKTNVTNFTVQIGLPWEGSVQDATVVNQSKISDDWNSPADNANFSAFERWNVTFTAPSNMRKGGNMVIIKVNNYLGESTEVFMFATASKLSIAVPDTEGIFMTNYTIEANASNATQVTNFITQFRVNLTNLSSMYNANSKSGLVCAKINFSATRFTFPSADVTYSSLPNTSVFLIDNSTPGVYDTLVVSRNNGTQIAVAHANNRTLSSAGFSGLYFIRAIDCGFAEIVNGTAAGTGFGSGYGGQHAVNSVFDIPFIVRKGTTPRANVVLDVFQMVQQEDFGGGRGGFGFVDFLAKSNYTVTPATTDSNGVAFLRMNVSRSGLYSIMWNFTDGSDTDTADFSQGVPLEIKAFRTSGDVLSSENSRVVTLTLNDTALGIVNATVSGGTAYLGSWNESSQGELLWDGNTSVWRIALRNVVFDSVFRTISDFSNIIMDDDSNLSEVVYETSPIYAPASWNYTSGRFFPTTGLGTLPEIFVDGNRTINSTVVQLILASRNYTFSPLRPTNGTRADVNVTARACAGTFSRPETPLIGANVSKIITEKFSFSGPPQVINLTVYDPFTNATTQSVLTGPSGCAIFRVSRIDPDGTRGWSSGFSNEIKATITSGSAQEQMFVGSVFVMSSASGGFGGVGGGG